MFLIIIGILILANETCHKVVKHHPDEGLTTVELVRHQGYPIHQFVNLETPDGYLLTLHRIPHAKGPRNKKDKRPVVLLMHGLLCSSTVWVNMGSTHSLGYLLADAGYDVWMGNARGSMFSRKHINYDPDKDSEFWQFSWHEIGTIDLPTIIDFILNRTGEDKLHYIGHSQGTTVFFVMTSVLPEYNEKIKLMIALAPVAFMGNVHNDVVRFMADHYVLFKWLASLTGVGEFMSSEAIRRIISKTAACEEDSVIQDLCINVIFMVAGWDPPQMNRTMIPVIVSTLPAGSSILQLVHYGQIILSGRFRQYDYGEKGNYKKYGTNVPPDYDVENITCPVALMYAKHDALVAEEDVETLIGLLPNLVSSYVVPYKNFSHFDYLFAIDVKTLVYDYVMKLLRSH